MSLERFMAATETLGDREIGIIASTSQLARDGHILETSGIDLSAYRKNPVVLFSHQPEQPIGACTAVGIEDGVLAARVEFAPQGLSAVADEVCALVKAGVLRGVSVGFQPLESEPLDPKEPWSGQHITKSELYEISLVSVPADTGAGVVSRSFSARQLRAVRSLAPIRRSAVDGAMALLRSPRVPEITLTPQQHVGREMSRANTVWAMQEASRRERDAQEVRRARFELLKGVTRQ